MFDINYRKAPKSDASGEVSSPFQLDIKKPEPFSKTEYTKKDFDKLSFEKQKEIKKVFINLNMDGLKRQVLKKI